MSEPRIVELFVHGASRTEKADLLEVIAALLGAHGIEPGGPVDRESCRLDVLLAADWRDLPIARAVIGETNRAPDGIVHDLFDSPGGERRP